MAAKRKSYRQPPPAAPTTFGLDRILNLGAAPIITALVTLVGFYFSTNAALKQQGDEQKATAAKVEAISKQVADKTDADTSARVKIREDFLASQVKTAEGIAKLDTRLAVAETQQNIANQQLQKIADTLEKLSSFATGKGTK